MQMARNSQRSICCRACPVKAEKVRARYWLKEKLRLLTSETVSYLSFTVLTQTELCIRALEMNGITSTEEELPSICSPKGSNLKYQPIAVIKTDDHRHQSQ